MATVTKDTIIGDILDMDRTTAPFFLEMGMHCLGLSLIHICLHPAGRWRLAQTSAQAGRIEDPPCGCRREPDLR